jgi:hypothetical protein
MEGSDQNSPQFVSANNDCKHLLPTTAMARRSRNSRR